MIRSLAILLIVGCLGVSGAYAQVSGGAFRGEVRDASTAVLPHAKIAIRSVDTGVEIVTESDQEGLYVTPTLISGSYELTAVTAGFNAELFGPVLLQVNQIVRVDFTLQVGATSDSIRLEAPGAQLLSPETAEISQVIARKEVAEIPLKGRKWEDLIRLIAGVNPGAPSETGSPNADNINGQRTKTNLYLVDGISTTSSAQGRGNSFDIPLDAVREFSVQAGAYSAEYGNVAGGVVNLQSKSGTNQWHGSAFEFFRNDAMDAANFFSNATGQSKNQLHYNQFGGSLGGPIRHDRTFLFTDYQGTITHAGMPMIITAETGTPFSIIMPCAAVNSEGNNCRPNLLGNAVLPADRQSINHWFNAAAFRIPSPAAYGNAGRNIFRGPGLSNFDAALSKSFSWGAIETRRIQFRSEFFNALNHTNQGVPVNSTSSPALGTITSAAPARIIQLGLRLEL